MHEFLALLAHELSSPLAAMLNRCLYSASRARMRARQRVRGIMERQTQFIGRLVKDLLDVSYIEQGKIRLNVQSLDLAQTVTQAVETVAAVRSKGAATCSK